MENTNTEVIDSQDDVQTQTEETNETTLTVDDYRKLETELAESKKRESKLFERVKKQEKSSENKPLVNVQQDNSKVTEELARIRLKLDHGISDPEALDFIMKNGGEKALENPYIKGTIDTMIAQKKAEAGAVSEDSGKSEVFKKHTPAELKAMSSDELEKIMPHA